MTFRRLSLLVDHLPSESATKTALRNAYTEAELRQIAGGRTEHPPFSHEALILAELWDLIAGIAHGLGGGKGEVPKYPRPGAGKAAGGARTGRMTPEQMAAYEKRIKRGG